MPDNRKEVGKAIAYLSPSPSAPLRTAAEAVRLRELGLGQPVYYSVGTLSEVFPRGTDAMTPHFVTKGTDQRDRVVGPIDRETGGEGVFHVLIKALITERKRLVVYVADPETGESKRTEIRFRHVVPEQQFLADGRKYYVDLVATVESPSSVLEWCPGGLLYIEIYVTHQTERDKRFAFQREGVTALEVKTSDWFIHATQGLFPSEIGASEGLRTATDEQIAEVRHRAARAMEKGRKAFFIAGGPPRVQPTVNQVHTASMPQAVAQPELAQSTVASTPAGRVQFARVATIPSDSRQDRMQKVEELEHSEAEIALNQAPTTRSASVSGNCPENVSAHATQANHLHARRREFEQKGAGVAPSTAPGAGLLRHLIRRSFKWLQGNK